MNLRTPIYLKTRLKSLRRFKKKTFAKSQKKHVLLDRNLLSILSDRFDVIANKNANQYDFCQIVTLLFKTVTDIEISQNYPTKLSQVQFFKVGFVIYVPPFKLLISNHIYNQECNNSSRILPHILYWQYCMQNLIVGWGSLMCNPVLQRFRWQS